MPSWARFVATDTMGMPAMCAANLGSHRWSAAADAGHRLVGPGPEPLAQQDGAVHGGRLDPEHLASASWSRAVIRVRAGRGLPDGDPALVAILRSASSAPSRDGAWRTSTGDRRGQQPGEATAYPETSSTDRILRAISATTGPPGQGFVTKERALSQRGVPGHGSGAAPGAQSAPRVAPCGDLPARHRSSWLSTSTQSTGRSARPRPRRRGRPVSW